MLLTRPILNYQLTRSVDWGVNIRVDCIYIFVLFPLHELLNDLELDMSVHSIMHVFSIKFPYIAALHWGVK